MNAIIIYKGKYGATKQYALWLGHALGLPVRHAPIINREQLAPYDTLFIGSSVYIGKLSIRKWLNYNLSFLKGKKIVLFQVAGTPAVEKEKRQAYNIGSIPAELLPQCSYYFLPGRMIRKKLGWRDRFLLMMGARLTKDPKEKVTMLSDYDDVKVEHLEELINDMTLPPDRLPKKTNPSNVIQLVKEIQ